MTMMTKNFFTRLTPDEWKLLESMSKTLKQTKADTFRIAIKRMAVNMALQGQPLEDIPPEVADEIDQVLYESMKRLVDDEKQKQPA